MIESLIVLLVLAASMVTALRFLTERQPNPYGDFLPRAAMVACGRGFAAPGLESPALVAFSTRQRPNLTCEELVGEALPAGPGAFAANHRGLIYSAAAAIQVGGLSWQTLDRFVALLFGISMALAYGLLRLGVGRALAVTGVALLVCSDHLFQVMNLRDFAKEPWFLAAWLSLGWLLSRRGTRATRAIILPACVGGAVIGAGIGFRVDLMACLPAFPAVIALVVDGWDRRALKLKAVAIAAFLLSFMASGLPTLVTLEQGSNSGHVAVMGLTNSFTEVLGIEPPLYEYGNIYSDGFAHALIASHAVVVQHDHVNAALGTAEYDRQGFGLMLDNARNFPADVITRMLGATVQAIRTPFAETSRIAYTNSATLGRQQPFASIAALRARLLSVFDGWALWLAAIAAGIAYWRDWKTGVTITVLVFYFCGYVMIQYSRRHIFHLDIVSVGILVFAIHAGVALVMRLLLRSPQRPRFTAPEGNSSRRFLTAAGAALAVSGLFTIAVTSTRMWQQRHVSAALEHTLASPWESLPLDMQPLELISDGVAAPAWAATYAADPGQWGRPLSLIPVAPFESIVPPQSGNTIRHGYLRVDVGGAACPGRSVTLGLKYDAAVRSFDWEYTSTYTVPVERGTLSTALLPVYYWEGASRFDGIALATDDSPCIAALYRAARGTPAFPILAFVLPPDWIRLPLYQRLAK